MGCISPLSSITSKFKAVSTQVHTFQCSLAKSLERSRQRSYLVPTASRFAPMACVSRLPAWHQSWRQSIASRNISYSSLSRPSFSRRRSLVATYSALSMQSYPTKIPNNLPSRQDGLRRADLGVETRSKLRPLFQ